MWAGSTVQLPYSAVIWAGGIKPQSQTHTKNKNAGTAAVSSDVQYWLLSSAVQERGYNDLRCLIFKQNQELQ